MRAVAFSGEDALGRLGDRLEDLLVATGAPITARRPWLDIWVRAYRDQEPWAVVVERSSDEPLLAAAFFARRKRGRLTDVVAMGDGPSDYVRLAARDGEAAEALAAAIVDELRALRGPWQLELQQIPADDMVARAIAARLPTATLLPGEAAPRAVFAEERTLQRFASRNERQAERGGWNRVRRAGLAATVTVMADPDEIIRMLPTLVEVRRRRDTQMGRRTILDDAHGAAFWHTIIPTLAERGEAELMTLELDGHTAAYHVGLRDGSAYRMWDTRFDPQWERFRPGILIDFAAFRRTLGDASFTEYDWMRGVEEYKLRRATDVVETQRLLAWSSSLARTRYGTAKLAKAAVKDYAERHPAVAKVLKAPRRTRRPLPRA